MSSEPITAVKNGESTQLEYEYFFRLETCLSDEAKLMIEKDFANDLDEREIFLEGVAERLGKLGFESAENAALAGEVKRRFKRVLGENCPKAIQKWLVGEAVPSDINRANNYDLCLALEMDLSETVSFFIKNYMLIPFNFKDKTDAVYYFALRNNLAYPEIKALLSRAESLPDSVSDQTGTLAYSFIKSWIYHQ